MDTWTNKHPKVIRYRKPKPPYRAILWRHDNNVAYEIVIRDANGITLFKSPVRKARRTLRAIWEALGLSISLGI